MFKKITKKYLFKKLDISSQSKRIKIKVDAIKKWDWQIIMICFFLAFIFWVFKNLNTDHTTSISFPLNFELENKELVSILSPIEEININVSGYGWNLLQETIGINKTKIKIKIDNPLNSRYLTAKIIRSSAESQLTEMKINYIFEDTIFYRYDTLSSKKIKLELDPTKISLDDDYRLISEIEITPDIITMTGAYSIIKDYPDVICLTIDKNDIDESFYDNVKVNYTRHKYVSVDNRMVKVKFDIALFTNKRLPVKIQKENFPDNIIYKVTPNDTFIEYFIREDNHINIGDSIIGFIDFKELNVQDSAIFPRFYLPPQIIDVTFIQEKFIISKLDTIINQ